MSRPLNGSFGNDRIMLLARFLEEKGKFILYLQFRVHNFIKFILFSKEILTKLVTRCNFVNLALLLENLISYR